MRLMWLVLLVPLTQATTQNPSPMSDTTRPHPRVERYDVPGQRTALSVGTVYLAPGFEARRRHPLVIHLHGAPWLIAPRARTSAADRARHRATRWRLTGLRGRVRRP